LLSAAFSAAWLFRWGGVRHVRGTRTDGRSWLLRDRVDPAGLRGRPRVDGFRLLIGGKRTAAGAPAVVPPAGRVRAWRSELLGDASRDREEDAAAPARLLGLFPGANAPARRWPAERFAEVARAVAGRGTTPLVLGGPEERDVTARVAAAAPRAVDLGGRTDLADLAAILSLCDLVVTNDTGPMHLAGAVGTPTVSLWGSSDPREVRQTGSDDTPVTGADLPCKPCYRNHCHRRGRGTLLTDAHEECMRLIAARDVIAAVEAALRGRRAGE
jgi:heptosyltransferase-2